MQGVKAWQRTPQSAPCPASRMGNWGMFQTLQHPELSNSPVALGFLPAAGRVGASGWEDQRTWPYPT